MELSAITGLPYISIHAPPRGATENKNAFLAGIDISIHAPPRGATWSFPPSRDYPTFQFTPLREGRLKTQEFHAMAAISIHAPPRGATGRAIRDGQPKRFQFTPLREGRPSLHGFRSCGSISIHAPPRGATAWSCLVCHHCYFNSHPSARGDTTRSLRVCVLLIFQFTPLREGRPFPVATRLSRSIDFNSRPSARGDALRVRSRWLLPVHFNSRPSARGDKRAWRNDANCVLISIHAPPRGATPPAQPQIRTACVFQFTPLREGRLTG